MHQLLFKNRFNALLFVAIILISVRIMVGTDDERGALEAATAQFGADNTSETKHEQARAAPQPIVTDFTPDEELVDDTSGSDPSGWSSEPVAGQGPDVETADVQPEEAEI